MTARQHHVTASSKGTKIRNINRYNERNGGFPVTIFFLFKVQYHHQPTLCLRPLLLPLLSPAPHVSVFFFISLFIIFQLNDVWIWIYPTIATSATIFPPDRHQMKIDPLIELRVPLLTFVIGFDYLSVPSSSSSSTFSTSSTSASSSLFEISFNLTCNCCNPIDCK